MVSEKQVEKALTYLAETDESCAKAKARMKASEQLRKTAKATAFLKAEGSQGVREQEAYASLDFTESINEIYNATVDFETLSNKRLRAQLTIEVWRSLNSARKKGNIV